MHRRVLLYVGLATLLCGGCSTAAGDDSASGAPADSLATPLITPDEPPSSPPEALVIDPQTDEFRIVPLAFAEWEIGGQVVTEEPQPNTLQQARGALPLSEAGELEIRLETRSRPEYMEIRTFSDDPRGNEGADSVDPIEVIVCHHPPATEDAELCATLSTDAAPVSVTFIPPQRVRYLTVFATWTAIDSANDLDQYSAAWVAEVVHQ